ncbi:MAG: UDP-N-acetylglucosamine 1-carboxyvinyltransferase [Patescibacteria group bacterium]
MKYVIRGGNKLSGKIRVSGNKNSIFPCVGAALLTNAEVVLENMPDIGDTQSLIQILKNLGVSAERSGQRLKIKASHIKHVSLPKELMGKLRGSIVLVGAILGRVGRIHFYHPGGDVIGQRSIETHLEAFKILGADLKKKDLKFYLHYKNAHEEKRDCTIFLPEASVSATENIILASVLGKRKITIKNCPKEPHVLDLCNMLSKMGGRITGIGTDTLTIQGVDKLKGTHFKIGIDYVEVGTYIVAAAITGGKITIKGLDGTDLSPILKQLERFGISVDVARGSLSAYAKRLKSIPKLTTNIWPGFPTDLMSVVIVLATQSKGITLCHDWMYESRMFFIDKLIAMGARITLADPHRVFVWGPARFKGRRLSTPDIRAGMALVLAALSAKGQSVINQAELIERGYESVVSKLKELGADIERGS